PPIPTRKCPTLAFAMAGFSHDPCMASRRVLPSARNRVDRNPRRADVGLVRILLLAMPDTASSLDAVMKFPNLGLCSLAPQVPEHEVRLLDLVLRPQGVRARVVDEVQRFRPDLVGYSAMSFQYETARVLAAAVRAAAPHAVHVLGGYHATVVADEVGARDGDR